MHSAYLPKLEIVVPDQVLAFHSQWDGLAEKVRDEVASGPAPVRVCAGGAADD